VATRWWFAREHGEAVVPLPTEPPLWRRMRAGDEEAYATLFRTHYAALCMIAHRMLRNDAESEEVVQDVFLRLWERRGALAAVDDVGAYLRTAVRHRVIDRVRRDLTEQQVISHIAHEPAGDETAHGDRTQMLAHVQRAMTALPPRCRAAMQLRWFERRSYAEIATVLGISPKGVERLITRGLAALRRVVPAEDDR
jgi:RNA polymerase sigma-70 factor (ECF subfamily)